VSLFANSSFFIFGGIEFVLKLLYVYQFEWMNTFILVKKTW
jgi:hypothetical protein